MPMRIETSMQTKKKCRDKSRSLRRDKSQLDDHFIAPDGGWAWLICIAAGIINLTTFPIIQQFGLIFGDKFASMGWSTLEIAAIINTQSAVSACTGLLNGPMFQRFSFRKVALTGAVLIFSGLIGAAFSNSFWALIASFSTVFGFGLGIILSASSLAMDTYFKFQRPRATGFSWTITGMGPIFFPYIIPLLLKWFEVQGTVLILAALSLHAFMGALTFQPVKRHVAPPDVEMLEINAEQEHLCQFCEMSKRRNTAIFPNQYLYRDDDDDKPGFEITDPGIPMLARANDGWYGAKLGLSSVRQFAKLRTISYSQDQEDRRLEVDEEEEEDDDDEIGEIQVESVRKGKAGVIFDLYVKVDNSNGMRCTCAEERDLLKRTMMESRELQRKQAKEEARNVSLGRKIQLFLGVHMLRDPKFVALVIGLTLINFAEFNFTILTPFILMDSGLVIDQISAAMAALACTDLSVRYIVPFATERLNWDNRVFFSLSALGLVLGRTIVAMSDNYKALLATFIWMGIHKGVRTIFLPLILPCSIPMNSLPAASGLALIISGCFTITCGPFVGMLRDRYGYAVMIHFLNLLTLFGILLWITDAVIRICKKVKRDRDSKLDDINDYM